MHKYARKTIIAQICSVNKILHKYAARMKVCTNMHPEWKFAKNIQPVSKFA